MCISSVYWHITSQTFRACKRFVVIILNFPSSRITNVLLHTWHLYFVNHPFFRSYFRNCVSGHFHVIIHLSTFPSSFTVAIFTTASIFVLKLNFYSCGRGRGFFFNYTEMFKFMNVIQTYNRNYRFQTSEDATIRMEDKSILKCLLQATSCVLLTDQP